MIRILILLNYFGCLSVYQSCANQKTEQSTDTSGITVMQSSDYDFENPDDVFLLNQKLVEISGLAYDVENHSLLTINDEVGIYYQLSLEDGSILSQHRFAALGDYEGIEIMGDTIMITRSNGTVYLIDKDNGEAFKILKTDFHIKNDIEGITYDKRSGQLILACKGVPTIPDVSNIKKGKVLYACDANTGDILPEPISIIKDKALRSVYLKQVSEAQKSKIKKMKVMDRVDKFAPSGLAFHPESQELYIVSARNNSLVILDEFFKLSAVILLDKKVHRQPEGICFAPNGDLFISNEGQNRRANIYRYNLKKRQ